MSLKDVRARAENSFVEPSKKSALYKQTVANIRELYERDEPYDRVVAEALCEINYKMVTRGLKESTADPCISRLLGRRCNYEDYKSDFLPGSDHTTTFNKDGRPHVYITHPYDLSYETMREIVEYCESRGLRADVHATSWWFPGWTLCIEVRSAGKKDQSAARMSRVYYQKMGIKPDDPRLGITIPAPLINHDQYETRRIEKIE